MVETMQLSLNDVCGSILSYFTSLPGLRLEFFRANNLYLFNAEDS